MSGAHLHLVITHLPIFGTFIGSCVLAYGLWKKSHHTIIAAYLILLASAAGAFIAYQTGEAAEEVAERLAGVSKNNIEKHEDFAEYAFKAMIALACFTIVGLITSARYQRAGRLVAFAILTISLIVGAVAGWTGYLGGQIRHTEVHQVTDDDDDDHRFRRK